MFDILVVSHGKFAEGLLDSCQMLLGKFIGVKSIEFSKTMGVDELTEIIQEYLNEQDKEVLAFTDLKGGTPFNVVSVLTKDNDGVKVVYGMNLPSVIEAISLKDTISLSEVVAHLQDNVSDSIGISEL